MLNKKLKELASLINKEDTVIDIGCDHAYLAIYLKENNLCKEVYASDISENVLKTAINNIKKRNLNITTYLSNGFNNIKNSKIDTAIISGMGTSTILSIVNNAPGNIKKYLISSNNDYETLRKKMLKKGFYIEKESIILENKKYYPIMLFTKEYQKETNKTLKYGKSNNQEYYTYLISKEKDIIKRIPKRHSLTIVKHLITIKEIKSLTKRKQDYLMMF